MTKLVFRTHTGRTAQTGKDEEAVKAMTVHRFLPPQEQEKLLNAQQRFSTAKRSSAPTQIVLNSAADKVKVEPSGVVAAIRARSGK